MTEAAEGGSVRRVNMQPGDLAVLLLGTRERVVLAPDLVDGKAPGPRPIVRREPDPEHPGCMRWVTDDPKLVREG